MDIESLASMVDEYSIKNKTDIRKAYHECCEFLNIIEDDHEFKAVKQCLFDRPRKLEDKSVLH